MKTLRYISLLLAATMLSLSLGTSQAAMVSNQQIIYAAEQTDARQTLLQTLKRDEVQQQLLSLGVSPADVESRIQHMSHAEISQLNQKIDELPAGSGVLGAVVFIFVVFVITDVIGATDIFPFIHPVN
ncbi:MAG TPA: DUF6627 family protein [Gammaproteobacteria bacterium]